jgi:endonuclease YncB( thermonuclease family)
LTLTLSGLSSTATLPPSATPTRSRIFTPTLVLTGILSPTLTLDVLSGTLGVSTTVPLTATLTLSATQILAEPSSTPAPALSSWCVPLNTQYQNARVLRVIDGVSVEVEIDGAIYQVRYLGIALPADVQIGSSGWSGALHRNQELVEGKVVLLARDRSQSDAEGRLLRYVISEGVFVNRALVESGYAVAESVPPNVSCDVVLKQSEAQARIALVGLWGPTPTPTRTALPPTPTVAASGNVRIAYLKYWGVGWQDPNEYIEIRNDSTWPVQLQGWTISDSEGHQFTFPSFIFKPGAYCRVYSHKLAPGVCNFSFYNPAGIWDDEGDCAFLKDALGNLVDKLCYE